MNFETIFSKKQLTLIVKTTILVLATYIIFKKMGIAKVSINSLNISALTVLLTLSFLNWSLEIKKWQLLVSSFKKIKEENAKIVFDYEAEEKAARSHVAKLRKSKTAIANLHKEKKKFF